MLYRAKPADGIAWVTGASSGIGRGVALELSRRGYRVAVTARRSEALDSLAREAAGEVFVHPCDVTDRAAMSALVAEMEARHGAIALAFLNAGGIFRDPPEDPCGENLRKTFDLNFHGVVNGLDPLVRAMQARGRGQVALCASIAGYGGLPATAGYCASKAALITMGEALHVDLQNHGITLQVVCPGYVRTPLTEGIDHGKPFMLDLDDAVQRVCDGFERRGFEIAFPRRLVLIVKALRMLPRAVYLPLMRMGAARRAARRL